MNISTSYMLAAVLSVGVLVLSPAFAQELPCPDCDKNSMANQVLLDELPVSVWTDAEVYDHDSIIMVQGTVGHLRDSIPVTITVSSPLNNIIAVKQIEPDSDRTYSATLKTTGNLWKYDGTYTIRVQYGTSGINNKVLVQLTGGVDTIIRPAEPVVSVSCASNELTISEQCIPFSITGGSVVGGEINSGTSIIIRISAPESGMITLSPEPSVFRDLELVFVDGEQWDEVESNGNSITVQFPAGAEEIEIVGGFVIPEFGTIAALILAVAIISIIAISARSRLSIMPKY